MFSRYLIAFAAIVASTIADDSAHHDSAHHAHHDSAHHAAAAEYGAPAPEYGAPAAEYVALADQYGAPADQYGAPAGAPIAEYGAPAAAPIAEYGAPSAEYGAPSDGYGAPADAYGVPQQYAEATGFADSYAAVDDAGFDLSQITELLPLFIAVFAAIIVAQLFAPLLGMLFGAKLDFTTGLLAPLSTAKTDLINAVLNPFNLVLGNVGTCTPAGRSLGAGWNLTPDSVLNMIVKANEIYSGN